MFYVVTPDYSLFRVMLSDPGPQERISGYMTLQIAIDTTPKFEIKHQTETRIELEWIRSTMLCTGIFT